MSKPLRVRRLTPQEGQQIQRIRRGGGKTDKLHVKWRRALVVHASAGGNTVPVIARLAATSEDRVREMIHRFNELGMRSLDPQWAGGRPRRITSDDEAFIIDTAKARPEALGQPFTRWSIRKLTKYLAGNDTRVVRIGRERLRQLLADHDVTFQRTKTWKESNDPDRDAKLDRIEHVLEHHPDRTFALDEFGPLAIRPIGGSCWAPASEPQRQPANYHKLHGVRQFHGCYSVGDDELWGVVRQHKSGTNTLRALKSIRARRPDRDPIYVILDNLSAHKGKSIRQWAARNNVRAVFHTDLQLVGEPDRGALRAPTRVRVEQLEPPEPRRADTPAPRPPPMAQRQRPRPRTPRRTTSRTSQGPSREGPPMGSTSLTSRLKPPARTFVVKALARGHRPLSRVLRGERTRSCRARWWCRRGRCRSCRRRCRSTRPCRRR